MGFVQSKYRKAVASAAALLVCTTVSAQADEKKSTFGGPAAVGSVLQNRSREPISDRFNIGFDFNLMGLSAVGGVSDDAAGGVARLYGTVDLYGGAGQSQGKLTFKIEHRSRLGTDIAPQDLGFAVGYVGLPSLTFSDAGSLLTNLYWTHTNADDRWAVVAGITDTTDYVDVYSLGNPWAEFSNLVFSTNPTIPVPSQGFAIAGRFRFGSNGYVLAGFADANADPSDPFNSVSDFFSKPEAFSHAEFGWVGSWDDRFSDNVHLTLWHADARVAAGVPSGKGAAIGASWKVADRWLPFARVGASDGGGPLLDRSASFGVGYDTGRKDDRLAFGLNWGRPNEGTYGPGVKEQITAEAYWRFSAADWLEVTPTIQYVRNPALNPTVTDNWFLGLRLSAKF